MLIQIHMLQNYAPSNLNRDDSGAPKDSVFGGYQRGRISSQAIKRSIRRSTIFEAAFQDEGLLAQRTKELPEEIKEALETLGAAEAAREQIAQRVTEIGKRESKATKKEDEESDDKLKTQILVFLGADEVQQVAERLWERYQEVGAKEFAKLKVGDIESTMQHEMPRSVDIAMFGRMTTSPAFEDVHAAVQVAHALSTNTVAPQFDYFTAVDDISGESGAGMIGTTEFNSNTYYKYFSIHWEKLVENLGGDEAVAREAVAALIEAAALANPSGKQNSFAAHNPPDFVMVEVTERNIPINYANAFAAPMVPSRDATLMQNSVAALTAYINKVRGAYGTEGALGYLSLVEASLPDGTAMDSLKKLQAWTTAQVGEATHG